MTNKTHWHDRAKNWNAIGAPLNPNQEIIDHLKTQVDQNDNILLLGVTPQIYHAFNYITAVDKEPVMIEKVWPGNTINKRAILANWLAVDLKDDSFDTVLGDGSINMLMYPGEVEALTERCRKWLKPGGKFICRMFTRPDQDITREWLIKEAANPSVGWVAFRRLVPMAFAAENGSLVPWAQAYNFFHEVFPDKSMLKFTAEEIEKFEAYKGVSTSTWFPTRQEITDIIPDGKFTDFGTYDIAHTCPFLVIEK
jgi:SAM-dependent methyltransferase